MNPSESNRRDGFGAARSNPWYGHSRTTKERHDADRTALCDCHHWDPARAVSGADIESFYSREKDVQRLVRVRQVNQPSIVRNEQ